MNRAVSHAVVLGILSVFLQHSIACSVPVFRYGLERWQVDPYLAMVFHRGPLSAADSALMRGIGATGANLMLQETDVSASEDSSALVRYGVLGDSPLPCIAVYPVYSRPDQPPVWSAPFEAEPVKRLIGSPIRREVVRRLLSGETCVWLIVTGSDRAAARRVVDTLRTYLPRMQDSLKIPSPDPVAGYFPPSPGVPLRIAFSTLVVSAADPSEQVLLRLLLGGKARLDTLSDPVVFPLFGRGRALVAIPPAKMTGRAVREVCTFLAGPCACTVKQQNPGFDLVFAVDWDSALRTRPVPDEPPPPLSGLSAFAAADTAVQDPPPAAPAKATASPTVSPPGPLPPKQALPKPSEPPAETVRADTTDSSTGAALDTSGSVAAVPPELDFLFEDSAAGGAAARSSPGGRGMLLLIAAAVVLVAAGSCVLLAGRRQR